MVLLQAVRFLLSCAIQMLLYLPALMSPSSCHEEQGAVVMAIYVPSSEEPNWVGFFGACSIIAVDTTCARKAAAVLPP